MVFATSVPRGGQEARATESYQGDAGWFWDCCKVIEHDLKVRVAQVDPLPPQQCLA